MIEGLKPCPECWGEGHLSIDFNSGGCYVICEDCGAYTNKYNEEGSAISDWNNGKVMSHKKALPDMSKAEAQESAPIQDDIELRLCPSCGGEGLLKPRTYEGEKVGKYTPYYVVCKECGVHTALVSNAEIAAEEWNSRTTMRRV